MKLLCLVIFLFLPSELWGDPSLCNYGDCEEMGNLRRCKNVGVITSFCPATAWFLWQEIEGIETCVEVLTNQIASCNSCAGGCLTKAKAPERLTFSNVKVVYKRNQE